MNEKTVSLILGGIVLALFAYVGIAQYGASRADKQCAVQGGIAVRSVSDGAVCLDKVSIIKLK